MVPYGKKGGNKWKYHADWKSTHSGRRMLLVSEEHYYSAITCPGKHQCSLHWRLPSSVEGGQMNSASFIYHTSCLLCSTKDEKGGNKWQSKSITQKRIMSPVKYTLCSMSPVFFSCVWLPPAHIFEIEFWKPYTLLRPFMLHQFTEVGSFFLPRSLSLPFRWDKTY